MATISDSPQAQAFLTRLSLSLQALPIDRQLDIVNGVREHIDEELAALSYATPTDVQAILTRLGSPEEIAREAGVTIIPKRPALLEYAAVLLIAFGSYLIPIIGGIAGFYCLWMSDQWIRRDKIIATILGTMGIFSPILLVLEYVGLTATKFATTLQSCNSMFGVAVTNCNVLQPYAPSSITFYDFFSMAGLLLMVIVIMLPLVAGAFLAFRLRKGMTTVALAS